VACFPKFSQVFNIFSPSREKTPLPNDLNGFERNSFAPEVIKAAIDHKFDGVKSHSPQVTSLLPRLAKALKCQLKPRGERLVLDGEDGGTISARRTGFSRIFKQSKGKQFSVSLASGQTLTRSRSEVETHALLQSFLKTQYGDTTIRRDEVLPAKLSGKQPQGAARHQAKQNPGQEKPHARPIGQASCPELQVPLLWPENLGSEFDPDHDVATPLDSREASEAKAQAVSQPGTTLNRHDGAAVGPTVSSAMPTVQDSNVNMASIREVPLTNIQTHMLQFIKDRLQLPPLEFLDQVSREDPVVAAYFAVQTAKMLTPTGPTIAPENVFAPSAHPDLMVKGEEHYGAFSRPEVQFQNVEKQVAAERSVQVPNILMLALLDDLKQEMAQQNQAIGNLSSSLDADNAAVLPAGIRASANASVASLRPSSDDLSADQRIAQVLALLAHGAETNVTGPAARLAAIAAANPAAAAFCGVVDEMLLIKGGGTPLASTKRFPYCGDYCDRADLLPNALENNGQMLYETFLPSIRHTGDVGGNECPLRILAGNNWIEGESKSQVTAHVAKEALRHMTSTAIEGKEQQFYPLITYELLGQAANIPVPQHLKDAEASAYAVAAQNEIQIGQRNRDTAAMQKLAAEEKIINEEKNRLRFYTNNVANSIQNFLTLSSFNFEKVTKDSIDRSFSLAPNGTALAMVREMQKSQLSLTHKKQAISARPGLGRGNDNHCWLRSSWLSVLCSATPAMLSERYVQMSNQSDDRVPGAAKSLHGIASRFRNDPVAFLHPTNGGKTWENQVGSAAFLEQGMLSDGTPRPPGPRRAGKFTTESNLKNIQLQLASCFRFENPSMMREVEAVWQNSQASSDLAITLHRAFNLPALIVEAGAQCTMENGERDLRGTQIRVAAPVGSELAQFIEAASLDNLPIDEQSTVLTQLLFQFKDLPIIWLEEGHYEVYVPNGLIYK